MCVTCCFFCPEPSHHVWPTPTLSCRAQFKVTSSWRPPPPPLPSAMAPFAQPPPSHHKLSSMPSAVLGVGRTGVRRRRDVFRSLPSYATVGGGGGPEQHTVVEKPRGRAGLNLCLKASAPRGNITEFKLALLFTGWEAMGPSADGSCTTLHHASVSPFVNFKKGRAHV